MFKFIDRKQNKNLVLAHGWAFDYRIFTPLELPYNYFLFCGNSITDFEAELKKMLSKNNIGKISLLGWSQGASAACNFAIKNTDITEEIILIGLRKRYEKQKLKNIEKYIKKNRKAYLYKFYSHCFCEEEKNHYNWFKNILLKDYLEKMTTEQLINGLDQLSELEVKPRNLDKLKSVKLIHGRADAIAPINEAIDIVNRLREVKFIVFEQTGHLPFLRKDFKRRIYE